MGIALSTHGILWPHAAILREQFQGMDVDVEDTTTLEVSYDGELSDVLEISVDPTTIEVQVEVLDSVTGEIVDDSIDVTIECT